MYKYVANGHWALKTENIFQWYFDKIMFNLILYMRILKVTLKPFIEIFIKTTQTNLMF